MCGSIIISWINKNPEALYCSSKLLILLPPKCYELDFPFGIHIVKHTAITALSQVIRFVAHLLDTAHEIVNKMESGEGVIKFYFSPSFLAASMLLLLLSVLFAFHFAFACFSEWTRCAALSFEQLPKCVVHQHRSCRGETVKNTGLLINNTKSNVIANSVKEMALYHARCACNTFARIYYSNAL